MQALYVLLSPQKIADLKLSFLRSFRETERFFLWWEWRSLNTQVEQTMSSPIGLFSTCSLFSDVAGVAGNLSPLFSFSLFTGMLWLCSWILIFIIIHSPIYICLFIFGQIPTFFFLALCLFFLLLEILDIFGFCFGV